MLAKITINDKNNILIYERTYESDYCLIALNNSNTVHNISIPLNKELNITAFKNLLNNQKIEVSDAGLNAELLPVSGAVLFPIK